MREDFVAMAQHYRAEHEATHGEAEMCGVECIVLGLAGFDDYGLDPLRALRAHVLELPVWDKRSVPGGKHVSLWAVLDLIKAAAAMG